MKKNGTAKAEKWEMRKEYDFSETRPNKYAKKYAKGTNIVVIDPDLVEFFPNSESVNATLRAAMAISPKATTKKKLKKQTKAARHKSAA
ncbi:MAG: hypothetical protein ACREOO_15880 [bacterium]